MPNQNVGVSNLLFHTSQTIRNIQKAFRDSLVGLEDRSTPKAVFFLTDRISNSLKRRLESISKEFEESLDAEGAQVEARSISVFTDQLAEIYEIVKNSRDTGNLMFIIRPLEQLARKVYYDTRIIVNSVTEYNYTYKELVSSLLSAAEAVQGITEPGLLHDDIPKKTIRLGFPVAESENVLSYAGLAHEVSHFVYDFEDLESKCEVKYSAMDYETINSIVLDSLGADHPLFEPVERSQLEGEIADMVHSWVKEVVCDCLAVHIMGPAFLFMLFDMLSLRGDIHQPSEVTGWTYYPPPVVRFRNILDSLTKLQPFEWSEFEFGGDRQDDATIDEVKTRTAEAMNHMRELSDTEDLRLDRKHALAYGLTKSTLERLHSQDFFATNTCGISFPTGKFRKYFMRLYRKLSNNIPINEVEEGTGSREATDFRVILNVGWVRHLVARSQFADYDNLNDIEAYKGLAHLNKVLKKSLELSELDTLFRSGRG